MTLNLGKCSFFMKLFVLSGLLSLAGAASVEAASGSGPSAWLGAQGGLVVPNYANSTARTAFGITAGAKLGSEYGFGAYYRSSSKDEAVAGATVPFNFDLYGVMFGYFFEGEALGVHVGGLLGLSKVTTKAQAENVSTSPMHWGVVAGYDHMLGTGFSLGGELSYVAVSSSTAALTTGTNSSLDAFSTLNFLGSVKLWF